MRVDLLIRGGRIVSPPDITQGDLAVHEGKVVAVGDVGSLTAARIIDASDLYVLPGLIDPHVHFQDTDPGTGAVAPDAVYPLSRAAAFGGNTMLIDFVFPKRSEAIVEAVQARRRLADSQAAVDYGLHAAVLSDEHATEVSLAGLASLGISSIKVIMMAPPLADEDRLFGLMKAAAHEGLLVMVHAEDATLLNRRLRQLVDQNHLSIRDFSRAHPMMAELVAVQRAIRLTEEAGGRLYIVHMASGEAVGCVRRAQQRGVSVLAETVTHYLTLTESVYSTPQGANLVCAPPIRSANDQEALWQGVAEGVIEVIASDHAGYSSEQKMAGQDDFRRVPKGIAGVETRAAAIFSGGVVQGKVTLLQFVDLLSTRPARIFGLYPRKGVLVPGSDADICLFDPNLEWTVTAESLHFDWGYSPHEGLRLTGKPVTTILRGKVMVENGIFLGSAGDGLFVPRVAAGYE